MSLFKVINVVIWVLLAIILSQFNPLYAQNTGVIQGAVKDKNTQELLIGVTVQIDSTQFGAVTDLEGNFKISNVPVGSYNIKASFVGYKTEVMYNIVLTSGNASFLSFELSEDVSQLEGVEVVANKSVNIATLTTPLSVQSLTTEEIRSNPGSNFDISRVVQSLPGVGILSGGNARNDIIVRGGAPNENVYYLDGIEIPIINHFSTQGSAGGPQGLLNTSLISDVKLSSSAFDARFDNALASVLEFKQKDGNPDRFQGNFRLSSSEVAFAGEIPVSKKTSMIFSVRRSYLEFLFQLIDLPIRPNYWDFQYKVTHKFNAKTTLSALSIGAIDEFRFGKTRKSTPESEYFLRSVPSINQWNYTVGLSLKRLINNGYINVALSRNEFNNRLDQFEDAKEGDETRRSVGIKSLETENKLRIDYNKVVNGWKYSFGVVGQYLQFTNNVFTKIQNEVVDASGTLVQPRVVINFNTGIDFLKYGAFFQVSRSFINSRLGISFGLRTDMNSFTTTGYNPLETLSPRLALSYALTDKWKISASVGSYYKAPINTALSYKDDLQTFVNKDLKYTHSIHYVAGLEFIPQDNWRITFEGFYKDYDQVPITARNGISLANQGASFGTVGNEALNSNGKGRAYGFELFMQKKLSRGLFAVVSYTYVRSEFTNGNGQYAPSSWDNQHLLSALLGRKFKKGWEIGLKYRLAGGQPFTPFDLAASQRNYIATGQGTLDYNRINTSRLGVFNQFDFRVDKKWNAKRFTFDLYLDVVNAFALVTPETSSYSFARNADNTGFATTDNLPLQNDGSNAIPKLLNNSSGTPIPNIGFIMEF
jgi:TonB dependent receptor/CarboxypepD_reg-like domain/TonB-dependent Receptor Plug Domain